MAYFNSEPSMKLKIGKLVKAPFRRIKNSWRSWRKLKLNGESHASKHILRCSPRARIVTDSRKYQYEEDIEWHDIDDTSSVSSSSSYESSSYFSSNSSISTATSMYQEDVSPFLFILEMENAVPGESHMSENVSRSEPQEERRGPFSSPKNDLVISRVALESSNGVLQHYKEESKVEHCAICFETLAVHSELSPSRCCGHTSNEEEDKDLHVLDCGHKFHVRCLGRWRLENDCCPICRERLEFHSFKC